MLPQSDEYHGHKHIHPQTALPYFYTLKDEILAQKIFADCQRDRKSFSVDADWLNLHRDTVFWIAPLIEG